MSVSYGCDLQWSGEQLLSASEAAAVVNKCTYVGHDW